VDRGGSIERQIQLDRAAVRVGDDVGPGDTEGARAAWASATCRAMLTSSCGRALPAKPRRW
jgi:hypothetical protein